MSEEIKEQELEQTALPEQEVENQSEVVAEENEQKPEQKPERAETEQPEQPKQKKSIDDLYVEKKMKKRRIAYIASLAVTLAIVTIIVVLSCVKIDLRPQFITAPDEITIYSDEISSGSAFLDKDDSNYQEFMDIYNGLFEVTYMSALFNGNFGEYDLRAGETIKTFDETSSALSTMLGANYVKFYYSEPMKLKNKDGSEYKSKYGANIYKLSFQTVYFAYDSDNTVKDLKFYIVVQGNNGTDTLGNAKKTITSFTLRGNTSSIYKNLDKFRTV